MKTYLVGGAVRDRLLGLPARERDHVVVGATPEEMTALGYRPIGRDFPVFLHPETHEEYALARTERKTAPGHQGFAFNTDPSVTLEDDLMRRDLTINAIAQDESGSLIDPYGGQRDLGARLLRHVSPAFNEDPLRVFRVARFSARFRGLGFRVAEETLERMRAMIQDGELSALAPERVFQELRAALMESCPECFVSTLNECDAWSAIFPSISDTDAVASALRHTVETELPEHARFACMAWHSADVSAFCESLRVPRAWTQLSELLAGQFGDWQSLSLDDAEGMLRLIETADGIRKPERFAEFCASACVLADDVPESSNALQQVHARLV